MIKHIAPIVNKTKILSIVTGAGRQWIGDGSALYPCIGLPVMRDENIITILGLDPSKITIQHPKNLKINFGAEDEGYLDPDDMALVERGPSIFLDGELCRTYYSICGAIVAKERYFKPIEADKTQAEDPAYYLRIDGNFCYIVALKGLNVFGYICPINYWNGGDLKRMFQRFVNNIEIAARKFGGHEE